MISISRARIYANVILRYRKAPVGFQARSCWMRLDLSGGLKWPKESMISRLFSLKSETWAPAS